MGQGVVGFMLVLLGFWCSPVIARSPQAYRSHGWVKRTNATYGSHYFIGSSAIGLDRGDGFYKNTLVTYNSVTYGLSDHLSAYAALDLASLIASKDNGPVWSARLQLNTHSEGVLHAGVNVFYLNVLSPAYRNDEGTSDPKKGFGAAMGLLTLGDPDNNLTLSGGWFTDGQQAGRGPLWSVAGAVRLFPNVQLISENWIYSDPDDPYVAFSGGIRVLGNELAIDVGLVYDEEFTSKITPIGAPFVSATLNF